jgi:hypothetical protein
MVSCNKPNGDDRHDILVTEIVLKVALYTIKQTKNKYTYFSQHSPPIPGFAVCRNTVEANHVCLAFVTNK